MTAPSATRTSGKTLLALTWVSLLVLVFSALPAGAQVITASVTGQVSDPSGAAIPKATVTVTDLATAVQSVTHSDSVGHYVLPYLPPSRYSVLVSAPGFRDFKEAAVLTVNATVRVDATLQVGSAADVVTVTSAAGLLQTETGEVQNVLPKQFVEELPLQNRNYQNLLVLLPGNTPPTPTSTALQNPQGSTTFYSDGRAPSSNSSIIDGIDNTEPLIGVVFNIPSAEVIDEVHVEAASYSAEFGSAGGAVVTATSRSGSNQLHGSAYGLYQGAFLKARNYFNVLSQPKGNLVFNQDGAAVGGPIKRDRTFFFASFLDYLQSKSTTTTATVAPNAWRNGDFTSVAGLALYNPFTGTNGTGRMKYTSNQLDPNTFSPVAKAILPYIPVAQSTALANNYTTNVPFSNRGTSYDGRVDQTWSERLRSFVRFNYSHYNINNPGVLGPVVGDSEFGMFRTETGVVSTTWTLSPTLLTNFIVGYNRYHTDVEPLTNQPLNSQFGINDPNPNGLSDVGLAIIAINGATSMGTSTTYPITNTDNIFDFINNWTKTVRSHSIKFGAEFRDLRLDRKQATGLGYGPRGTFAFNPSTTLSKGVTVASGTSFANAFAAFLLGAPDTTSRTFLTATPTNRQKNTALFVQDNWQITKKLTLNLGLRWELFTPITPSKAGGASNYDPDTNNLLIAGVGGVGMSAGVQTDYKDFAPRVGFAYRIAPQTVLRGGYAIGYYTGTNGYTGGTLSTQYPVVSNVFIGTANDYIVDGTFTSLPAVVAPPIPSNGIINPTPAQSFYAVPFHDPLPYDQSMNLTLQQQVTPTTSIQFAFVGTVGRRIPQDLSINAAPPGTGNTGRSLYAFVGTQSITQRGYTSQSDYEAGQIFLNQNLSHGVQFTASYTWSKTREGANPPRSTGYSAYGLSTGDRTNIFSLGHLIHLPFGKNEAFLKSGLASKVFGGFEVNGIMRFDAGTPFTIAADATSCNCPGNSQKADQVKQVVYLKGTNASQPWFDPTAFAAPGANRYGNSRIGAVRGPGVGVYDVSLFRDFVVRDRFKTEFRATAFNVTNTPQFANPASTATSSGFGYISSTQSSTGERQLELGARLQF